MVLFYLLGLLLCAVGLGTVVVPFPAVPYPSCMQGGNQDLHSCRGWHLRTTPGIVFQWTRIQYRNTSRHTAVCLQVPAPTSMSVSAAAENSVSLKVTAPEGTPLHYGNCALIMHPTFGRLRRQHIPERICGLFQGVQLLYRTMARCPYRHA
jgi:hypothetical protein